MNGFAIDPGHQAARRQLLSRISDELNIWGRTWRRRHGTPVVTVASEDEDDGTDGYEEEEQEAMEDARDEATA